MNEREINERLIEAMTRSYRHPGQINLVTVGAFVIVILWVCSCYAAWLSHWFSR
jgi:hypothetical protein